MVPALVYEEDYTDEPAPGGDERPTADSLCVLVDKVTYTLDEVGNQIPKLYTIAFLEKNILSNTNFYTIANLRNEQGEIIDSQMTFIIIELAKFDKALVDIQTDLDKLVYTMKTLHKTTEVSEYPSFWNEEWLKHAINELDTRKLTPEERASFARRIAANAEAVKAEKKKIEEVKIEAIKKALKGGKLNLEEIAEYNEVTVEFVQSIQKQIAV